MLKTILVPLDGSALALRALPYARALARKEGARIVLVWAVMAGYSSDSRKAAEEELQKAETALIRVSTHLERQGIRSTWINVNDEAGWGIINTARDERADLIVMTTHGRSGLGRWFFGSVAERVLRGAPSPILLVPSGAAFNWPADLSSFRTIVPLDGSPEGMQALDLATEVGVTRQGELILTQALQLPLGPPGWPVYHDSVEAVGAVRSSLSPLVAQLAERRIRSAVYVNEGPPHEVILNAARVHHANLIVMGTHARDGFPRLVLGSVALGVVQRSPIAVLLVRSTPVAERVRERPSSTEAAVRTPGKTFIGHYPREPIASPLFC